MQIDVHGHDHNTFRESLRRLARCLLKAIDDAPVGSYAIGEFQAPLAEEQRHLARSSLDPDDAAIAAVGEREGPQRR